MEHEYHCIEQLDLSGRQLVNVDPAFARFSLILTDNIVELMLYSRCRKAIVEDDGFFSYGRQYNGKKQYDAVTRKGALGHHFDKKLKFCRRLGILTETELDFIFSIHEYRNEAYHVGITHNDLLYPLAWQYHDYACDLFLRISPLYRGTSSNDRISDVVRRHTQQEGIRLVEVVTDISTAASSLKQLKPPLESCFAQHLSQFATARAEDFASALHFISDQSEQDQCEVLNEIQFHNFLHNEENPYLAEIDKALTGSEYNTIVARAHGEWTTKFPTLPTERWLKRAKELGTVTCEKLAMKKFQQLRKEIEQISPMVCEVANQLENQIQLESDTLRGK